MTVAAFVLYAVAVLSIGIWASRKPQDDGEQVHLGGREHGTLTSALSSSASTESGFVLLGMVGVSFSVGANAFWILPAGMFGYALNWIVLGPRLRQKSEDLGVVTVPELISSATGGSRVSRWAAGVAAFLALMFLMSYVSAQFSASGKALSSQFGIGYSAAVFLTAGLVAAYGVLGGFRAVSWSDNLQAIMMVFALVVLPVVVVSGVGGIGEMISQLRSIDPTLVSFFAGATGWEAVLAALPWLMLGLAYPGQPHAIARLMAAKDQTVFKLAPYIAMAWFIVVYTGAIVLGMAARAGFAELESIQADPETILPVLAVQFLPAVLAGVTLAAIIAAITSTADSTLIAAATTAVRDARKAAGGPEPRHEMLLMRVAIVLLAMLGAVLALGEDPVVFVLVLYAWSGLGASLGPTVIYCTLARAPRALPALIGLLAGGAAAIVLLGNPLDLLIAFSIGATALLAAHFFGLGQSSAHS